METEKAFQVEFLKRLFFIMRLPLHPLFPDSGTGEQRPTSVYFFFFSRYLNETATRAL